LLPFVRQETERINVMSNVLGAGINYVPSLIRGVLLAGKFRTHQKLIGLSNDAQLRILIAELKKNSNQSDYQSFDEDTLVGMGAALVFLRDSGIRDVPALKTMSAGDQRNALIVEIGAQLPDMASTLQGLSNLELVLLGLGNSDAGVSLRQPTFIRGVLLAGKFRTQYELNRMSSVDQRNTLIAELTKHSNQSNRYESFDDYTLAGMGAVLVFLREAGIRDDSALKTMSADDQRNTLIVEIDAQTRLGSRLQGLKNMDLVLLGLGVDPSVVFPGPLPPPLRPLPRQRLQFRLRGFTQFRSTDDFLQGARDEVYISAISMDSSTMHFGSDGKLAFDQVESPMVGDVAKDSVRGPWAQNPHVLCEFDLNRGTFPRHLVVTLLIVEEDNESLGDSFNELKGKVRDAITNAVKSATTDAIKDMAGKGVGAAVGGAVGGAFGFGAGFLAGLALDELLSAIGEGLANEVFSPRSRSVTILYPDRLPILGPPDWIEVKEHGALYNIHYDWHIEIGD
jgi:hypothetical protein